MNEVSFPNGAPETLIEALDALYIQYTVAQIDDSHGQDEEAQWRTIVRWEGPTYEQVFSDPVAIQIGKLRISEHTADWLMAFLLLVKRQQWEDALWSYLSCFPHGEEDMATWDKYDFTPCARVMDTARDITLFRMDPQDRAHLRQVGQAWLAAPTIDPKLSPTTQWCGFGVEVNFLRRALAAL